MRITTSMYYDSLYSTNNSKLNSKLFDVNKQIASGLKIQYAKDDVQVFSKTMRLDNELSGLGQIKSSTQSGYKMANQTDIVLNEFESNMNRMRTLLLQASNETNDNNSLDAIGAELRGIEAHIKNLANTSINGQYLFSGSAVDIKPISEDGTYNGNSEALNSFTGSRTQQQYNISGGELFLGEEALVKREVTTNVINENLISKYPSLQGASDSGVSSVLNTGSSIRELMGDTDNTSATANDHYFYIRGVKSDGTALNEKIQMQDDDSIESLLTRIGDAYGNTPNLDIVNVSLNDRGQIVIQDKMSGSSKLDFHMVAAVDFSGGGAADVTDINLLTGGETDFQEIISPTVPPANNLYVKEFVKSGYTPAQDAPTIDGLLYDRTQFSKDGSSLSSNVAQVLRLDNSFASNSTKISEIADISKGTSDLSDDTLDGNSFRLVGTNISGIAYDVQIDFASAGSTFSLDTNGDGNYDNGTYDIFDMGTPRVAVDADEMTYKQLMDVVNMVITDQIPTLNTAQDYDDKMESSTFIGSTYLSDDGKINFREMNTNNTRATMALHDINSGDFSTAASVMSFNSNNALTIRDPKTDFFSSIDKMITAVEEHKLFADASDGTTLRNAGITNSISMIDDIQDHIFRSHSLIGAQSNALSMSLERSELLEVSTMTLRSSVIDTDLAEASLSLTQLTLNYEAMLATVGKISRLSLVNYL